MAQIRFDNLGGPLLGPILSLGMGFGFRRRGPAKEAVRPIGLETKALSTPRA
jgi:hypothetical protein